MSKRIFNVIAVAIGSYCLGHYIGEERVSHKLLLVEQRLETLGTSLEIRNYLINKCTTEYYDATGDHFRISFAEFMLEYQTKTNELGEKELQDIGIPVEMQI